MDKYGFLLVKLRLFSPEDGVVCSSEMFVLIYQPEENFTCHLHTPFVKAADRSSSGLLEFEDVSDALMALMLCNHAGIQSPGKYLCCC
jgi:hypothetical protein